MVELSTPSNVQTFVEALVHCVEEIVTAVAASPAGGCVVRMILRRWSTPPLARRRGLLQLAFCVPLQVYSLREGHGD